MDKQIKAGTMLSFAFLAAFLNQSTYLKQKKKQKKNLILIPFNGI